MQVLPRSLRAVSSFIALAWLSSASPAWAQAHVHEHGAGELMVSLDGRVVLIEFETPLDNLVGFEQAPATAAQQQAFDQAVALLRKGESLFALPVVANCHLQEVQLELPFGEDGHAHGEHEHAHHHGDHEHDVHAEAHEAGHADVYAVYQFDCERPAAVDGIGVGLFETFPRLERLRARSVNSQGQAASELERGQTRLKL